MKILIADDDQQIANLLQVKLQKEGFTVNWADDGEKAVELALSYDWDLMLLDVMMPVYDGFQVLKKVKEVKPDLPIMFLTAKGQEKDVLHGFQLGAYDYISKPFRPAEVVARVKRLQNLQG